MAREARLWDWLKAGTKAVPLLHIRRIENLVGEGDPDVEGCCNGIYFEIELKGCDRPARGGKLNFEVRQSQVLWHRKRWRCGGNLWLYVRVGKGSDVCRYLLPGSLTGRIYEGVTEADLARMSVLPPKHSPVDLIRRVIQTPNLVKPCDSP